MMRLVSSLVLITLLSSPIATKPWRGITPLHSKRADAERVLGHPSDTSNHWSTYHTDTETVSILYSNGLSCQSSANTEWQVPEGTVVSITVVPRALVLFSTLTVDASKFRKTKDPHMLDAIDYFDGNEGESIHIVNGEVKTLEYFGGMADRHLRCSNIPVPQPMRKVLSYKFDSYGNLRRKDEEIRLDNFAISLTQYPESKGYIFGYSEKGMSSSLVRARLTRAKSYLVKIRKISPSRVVTRYGGKVQDFAVELYIVPKGAPPPSPFAVH